MTSEKSYVTETRLDDHITNHDVVGGWHKIGYYYNGWSEYSTWGAYYRLLPDGAHLWVGGQLNTGTVTDGTQVFVMPVGYRPLYRSETLALSITDFSASPATARSPFLSFNTNGSVAIYGGGGYSGGHFAFGGVIALDTPAS